MERLSQPPDLRWSRERLLDECSRRGWRIDELSNAIERVREAWATASCEDDLPQGFGWPGDLYDALEALGPPIWRSSS